MARRSSGGGIWLIAALVLIALVPKQVWITIGVLAGIAFVVYLAIKYFGAAASSKLQAPKQRAAPEQNAAPEPTLAELLGRDPSLGKSNRDLFLARQAANSKSDGLPASQSVGGGGASSSKDFGGPAPSQSQTPRAILSPATPEPERFYSAPSAPSKPPHHSLPEAPAGIGSTRWFKSGETVEIAGRSISGGLIYVGPKLTSANGSTDPALINPLLPIGGYGDYRERHTSYWPSYSQLAPDARNAFLSWLEQGRSHPDCDIGLVFLFFYGLERRVVFDPQSDPSATQDRPDIARELRRLLSIYGTRSESFKRYAGELLNWVELDGASDKLYAQPVPELPRTYELAPYLRLALGQASVDRSPLPPALALSWLRLSPEVYLRTAATRCPVEFERLFVQRYQDAFGAGLVLPKNRTKLKFVYQAASSGLAGAKITMGFGDIPDVTALTAPIKQLREIADQCTDELGSYSRLVGKDPKVARTLDGLLLLPASLWPPQTQACLREVSGRMRDGRLAIPLKDLVVALGGSTQPLNRDRVRSLARALEAEQIGFEPHVLAGARAPDGTDTVVLFTLPIEDARVSDRAEFQTAALTLQLAAAMAQADGQFHEQEVLHLAKDIDGWAHLNSAEQRRLHAHLLWLTTSPPTLASLKKKLEPLSATAKETLAAFMAALAQADGYVSPEEVKFLEKVYKALGVEATRVFSDVHAVGAGTASIGKTEKQGFNLDKERIAALQADTVRVSALLSKIFAEEDPAPIAPAPEAAEVELQAAPSPLGLDESHSAFLRLLLSRPEWSRSELEDAAADLDLMLDGALEQINEAAFEAFDEPLCEGEDPIEVHTDLFEKIQA